jgi:hypothetical protein
VGRDDGLMASSSTEAEAEGMAPTTRDGEGLGSRWPVTGAIPSASSISPTHLGCRKTPEPVYGFVRNRRTKTSGALSPFRPGPQAGRTHG